MSSTQGPKIRTREQQEQRQNDYMNTSSRLNALSMEFREEEYVDENTQLPSIIDLITNDLSEPYCIYTYRYFLHQWPQFCLLIYTNEDTASERKMVGVIIGRCELHKNRGVMRGYIAMLAVHPSYRKKGLGSYLVTRLIQRFRDIDADEV